MCVLRYLTKYFCLSCLQLAMARGKNYNHVIVSAVPAQYYTPIETEFILLL